MNKIAIQALIGASLWAGFVAAEARALPQFTSSFGNARPHADVGFMLAPASDCGGTYYGPGDTVPGVPLSCPPPIDAVPSTAPPADMSIPTLCQNIAWSELPPGQGGVGEITLGNANLAGWGSDGWVTFQACFSCECGGAIYVRANTSPAPNWAVWGPDGSLIGSGSGMFTLWIPPGEQTCIRIGIGKQWLNAFNGPCNPNHPPLLTPLVVAAAVCKGCSTEQLNAGRAAADRASDCAEARIHLVPFQRVPTEPSFNLLAARGADRAWYGLGVERMGSTRCWDEPLELAPARVCGTELSDFLEARGIAARRSAGRAAGGAAAPAAANK